MISWSNLILTSNLGVITVIIQPLTDWHSGVVLKWCQIRDILSYNFPSRKTQRYSLYMLSADHNSVTNTSSKMECCPSIKFEEYVVLSSTFSPYHFVMIQQNSNGFTCTAASLLDTGFVVPIPLSVVTLLSRIRPSVWVRLHNSQTPRSTSDSAASTPRR